MDTKDREAIRAALERQTMDLKAVGPTAAKRLARARFINAEMARYTEDGEFVWMPQYGGPEL